jgi:HEAT repeat protein
MSPTVSSIHKQEAPYKGLRPYEEEDRNNFFGRDADCRILVDKILANRLTLLFAAAGVGKSSLLQAKVLSQLKDPRHENLDVVYCRDWVSLPLPTLKQQVIETLKKRGRLKDDALIEETKEDALTDFFGLCTLFSRQPLVIALDQFEEFFHNQRYTAGFKPFIEQLAAVINDRNIPIAVVISMREDFALELNAFHPFIPQLFENHYRLQRLTKSNAREAIEEPVKRIGFRYEPALLDRLLRDLIWSEQSDFLHTVSLNPELVDMIDPVALQIVCSQLWDIEKTGLDKIFNLKTYEDKGGAEVFFRGYLDNIFTGSSPEKKYLAYRVFNHIVTRRGTKVAFTLNSLANTLLDADKQLLQELIDDFRKNLVLRYQWRKEEMWYEIYHDRFVDAIEQWSDAYKQERTKELSGSLEAFFRIAVHFSSKERRLTALALNRLTTESRTEEGYTTDDLAAELGEDSTELARVLDRLENLHIVRKKSEGKGFVLYDELFSGPIKQWNRNYHLEQQRRKRNRRNFIIVMAIIGAAVAPIIYDLYVNLNRQYFHLSVKEGLSKNVELYRGKPMSLDIFNIQKYIAETDYGRSQIEPVMLFKERAIKDRRQLMPELLGYLQPLDRIMAYWQDGQPDRAFATIEKALQDYPELRPAIIETLAGLRSLETIARLEEYLRDAAYQDLHEKIVTVMALLPSPRVLDILLAKLEDGQPPAKVRRAVVEALERMSQAGFGARHDAQIKTVLTQLLGKPAPVERSSEDEEALARLAAARTLGQLGGSGALTQLLEKDKHRLTRQGAVEALGGSGNAAAVQVLLNLVDKERRSNSFMRRSTVEALGQIGGPDVVDKLIGLITDDRVDIRGSVAEALGRTGDPRAVEPLIKQLETQEDEPPAQQSIVEALGRLGNRKAIQPLLKHVLLVDDASARRGTRSSWRPPAAEPGWLVDDDDPPLLRIAVEALGRIGTAEMCQTLIDQLAKEADVRKRRVIIGVLGRLGAVQAIAPLQAVQNDAHERPVIRLSAADALVRLGESTAVEPLIAVLNEEKGRMRLNVAGALGRLGHHGAHAPLKDKMQQGADTQDIVYLGFLEALGQLGDASVLDALTTWLQRRDGGMRQGNLETLVGPSTARWFQRWITMQSGEEGYVRQAAVEALGRLDSLRPVELLMARLSDGSVFVRRGAARALGRLGRRDMRVVEPLITRLNDGDSGVRQNAAEALGQLGNLKAVAPLTALLYDSNSDVRREAAAALGRLGDDRALQPLLSRFKGGQDKRPDGVEDVRRAALLAYAKIGLKSDGEHTGNEIRAVFKDASEHERIRLVAAVVLPILRPHDPPDDQIQAWLEKYAGSSQASHRKELAEMLGEFPTAAGTLLLFRLLEDENLSVKASALTALGLAKAQEALPELHKQLSDPNFRLQKAAAEALAEIASAESIPSLATVASSSDPAVSIPTRLASLNALHNIAKSSQTADASREKAIAGMLGAIQSEADEAILGIRTYNLLGDLQARQALNHLSARLGQEEARQREWRGKRDALEDKEATEKETRQRQVDLEQARSGPHLAFELAYNIARIDQKVGLALLRHDLAAIRQGAWLGLGKVGNVDLIILLRQKRQQSDDPLFRHAAYRAIDHIVLRLEAEAVDPQELRKLEALYPGEVGTLCTSVGEEEKGICTRVEWTIAQLKAKDAIHGQHPAALSANQN